MRSGICSDPCLRRYDHCKLLVLHTNFSAKNVAMLHASPRTMTPSLIGCTNVCKEAALISWQKIPPLCFTWLLLDATVGVVTKSASVHTWERHSWVVTPSINAVTWPSANGLSGWQIVMHSISSSLMMGKTLQSCTSKWDSCAGTWSLNTGMTCAWRMWIISHVLAQISALILSWMNMSSRLMLSAIVAQPWWSYLLCPGINRTSKKPHLSMPHKLEEHPSAPQPSALAAITTTGLQHLSTWLVTFGTATPAKTICDVAPCCLYNFDLTCTASMLAHFDWAVYSFNSGFFLSTIHDCGLLFEVVLAWYSFVHGWALFCKLLEFRFFLNSASAMLDHIWGSGIISKLAGYIIHSHRYTHTEPTSRFWDIQSNIVRQLRIIQSLSSIIAFVHLDHNCRMVSLTFFKCLHADGWIIRDTNISYPTYGDSIPGGCWLIVGVYSITEPTYQAFELKRLLSIPFWSLVHFIWALFNTP